MNKKNIRASLVGGLSGVVFLFGLTIAIMSGQFWLVFLMTLAFSALIGSFSTNDIQANLGGFQGFVFLMGLAVCTVIGWWPWIMVLLGISTVLGTLQGAFAANFASTSETPKVYEEPQKSYQQTYTPYEQGYQQPVPATYKEEEHIYQYPPQALMDYEYPQAQYPQEMPQQQ
jgi:hypothetical protein